MEKYIDLRSDTVTQPSQFMLDELVQAPLGDDVFVEDPTVNKLEENAAQLLGTEKALYMFVNDKLIPSSKILNTIYEEEKNEDGFLYVYYASESTFGNIYV